MPFDPFLATKLHLLDGLTYASIDAGTRARFAEFFRDPAEWSAPAKVRIQDGEVPGPHGPVPCRVYSPARDRHQLAVAVVAHAPRVLPGLLCPRHDTLRHIQPAAPSTMTRDPSGGNCGND